MFNGMETKRSGYENVSIKKTWWANSSVLPTVFPLIEPPVLLDQFLIQTIRIRQREINWRWLRFLGLKFYKMKRKYLNLLFVCAMISFWKRYPSATDVCSPNWSELAADFIGPSKTSSKRDHFCFFALKLIWGFSTKNTINCRKNEW